LPRDSYGGCTALSRSLVLNACVLNAIVPALPTAGQWEEVLPLCAFQGDFAALRNFTNKAPPGSQAARDGPLVRL